MTQSPPPNGGCPFTAAKSALTDSLTRRPPLQSRSPRRPFRVLENFDEARRVLKNAELQQAGFLADLNRTTERLERLPVLYMQGDEHTEMRRATARYFTPAAVEGYRPMIARLADDLIGELAHRGEAVLGDLSLRLAVQVAANVVGLTDSRVPGMEKRIEAFIAGNLDGAPDVLHQPSPLKQTKMAAAVALFFTLDVKPAIEARRKAKKDDLISYLLERDYSDQDILTECITYATAGMITTREFITLAAYQLLRRPELRAEYVHGTEAERHAILHELLRLDPVVTTLYRRPEGPAADADGVREIYAIDVQRANVDPAVMGENPEQLCPHRPLPRGVQPQGLAFGDGAHRCPGAFLAIKESDMFLRRLLMWNDLQIVQAPEVGYNETVKGYEIKGLRLRLGNRKGAA